MKFKYLEFDTHNDRFVLIENDLKTHHDGLMFIDVMEMCKKSGGENFAKHVDNIIDEMLMLFDRSRYALMAINYDISNLYDLEEN